jgi:adenosylmethionine-8-amino-7-oxononanoate aminotransferase
MSPDTASNRNSSRVFHREFGHELPKAVRGEGIWVIDSEGRRYLDASGGAAVSCLGHSHPTVIQAIQRQAALLPFAYSHFFTSEPLEELATLLVEAAPAGMDKVFFVAGGSEATEAALKLARQYHLEKGEPRRRKFIARRQSYHGNTLGALAVSGNLGRREPYAPMLMEMRHIAPCYAYREKRTDESEEAYGLRVADELDQAIRELGPENVAAFIAEPVVGATLGACPAVPGYFKRVREICDRHGVLLILDEVMCGMGRCGTLYACEAEGVVPDILTMAKGLGAGYQPIGAVIAHRRVVAAIEDGSQALMHGHTYFNHTIAVAAAVAVQRTIRAENLLENVRRQGARLKQGLEERLGNHRHVGDVRGRGLFLGIELVQDRASKRPFDPALKLHARLREAGMSEGMMCYPTGGCVDGKRGDHVILAPPYIVTDREIDEIVERTGRTIDRALRGLPTDGAS